MNKWSCGFPPMPYGLLASLTHDIIFPPPNLRYEDVAEARTHDASLAFLEMLLP